MSTSVFKISNTKESFICPPEQVFLKSDFIYMLTIGGHLARKFDEYQNLMNCLSKLGEKDFFILENFGTYIDDREVPFYAKIPVSSSLSDFNNIVKQFDPIFGLFLYHFFVYGKNDNWGIYLCECPTINIIGCIKEYASEFRKVFNIKGDGFKDLYQFISKEYETVPHLKTRLIDNYQLKF